MTKTDKRFTGYHRPVCVACEREMRPERNGVGVLDISKSVGSYVVYDADLWKCPTRGIEVVGGFGCSAIALRHDDNFQKHIDWYRTNARLINNNQ